VKIAAFAGLTALLLAFLPAGAAPGETVIPHPGGGPALIVPAGSPVRFTGFDENGAAHFSGRFVLKGTFVYDCPADCEPGMTEDDIELQLLPDPELAAQLPHSQDRGDGMVLYIGEFAPVRRAIASRDSLKQLLAGKIADVRGRVEIEVDEFAADFGCDYSPDYSARFIAVAKAPQVADVPVDGNFGCL
jgi:hypothetical protein